jgi:hypothetical protein
MRRWCWRFWLYYNNRRHHNNGRGDNSRYDCFAGWRQLTGGNFIASRSQIAPACNIGFAGRIAKSARHGSNNSARGSRREATRNSFSKYSRRSSRYFTNGRKARHKRHARKDNSTIWPQRDRSAIGNPTSEL